ncbi:4842_t:CDS:2, partial [Paraglomus occultum]
MISSTNNKSNQSETFAPLYEVLLYKKKDIIAIQKKLGINSNINQTAVSESKKAKKLDDSYKLLFELVGDLMPIQGKLGININPVLEAELRRDKASSDKSIRLFDLLLFLEDDIATIQEKIGIVGYNNQEMAEEADKNARVYIRKFEKFHGPLEDNLAEDKALYPALFVSRLWSMCSGSILWRRIELIGGGGAFGEKYEIQLKKFLKIVRKNSRLTYGSS